VLVSGFFFYTLQGELLMIMTAKAFWFGEEPNRGGTSELRSKLDVTPN
jgi:hypothetical protein